MVLEKKQHGPWHVIRVCAHENVSDTTFRKPLIVSGLSKYLFLIVKMYFWHTVEVFGADSSSADAKQRCSGKIPVVTVTTQKTRV